MCQALYSFNFIIGMMLSLRHRWEGWAVRGCLTKGSKQVQYAETLLGDRGADPGPLASSELFASNLRVGSRRLPAGFKDQSIQGSKLPSLIAESWPQLPVQD